jgi:hypothetical protein
MKHGKKPEKRNQAGQVADARKNEILEIYQDLFQTIWNRLQPTLGTVAVASICRSALAQGSQGHPLLKMIDIDELGIRTGGLREKLDSFEPRALRVDLLAFVDEILRLLTDLTGDILVGKIKPLVQDARQRMGVN